MLTLETRLDPNEEEIAIKVIDGEAIMVNLSNGMYYSLDGAGGLAWTLLAARHSLGEAAAGLASRYDVPLAQAQTDVRELAERLLDEDIVRLSPHAAPLAEVEGPMEPSAARQRLPYGRIELSIYRDMKDMLALDPPMPGLQDVPWKDTPDESEG